MKATKKEKQIFWDYDLSRIDLSNPKVMIWYLNRKLKFGDLSGIAKTNLIKYLPKLDISRSLRELLENYLKSNV
jgi:hypothetical protein